MVKSLHYNDLTPVIKRFRNCAIKMYPSQFDAWMKSHQLSLTTAAEALGISRRMIAHYRTGSRAIPKIVSLACKGWEVSHTSRAQVEL